MKYSKELHDKLRHTYKGNSHTLALLDEIERLQAERRWIPVSERLPEEENKSRLVYGDFFDKAVIALGFSSATLPTKEAEEKLLKRISDLVWLVRNLSDALDCVYGKLPAHWRELPFSYHELKRKVKEVMKNE